MEHSKFNYMAGVNPNDGTPATESSVPSIGGPAMVAGTVPSGNRAEGVAYPEAFGSGPTGSGYPAGTAMSDSTPSDNVN